MVILTVFLRKNVCRDGKNFAAGLFFYTSAIVLKVSNTVEKDIPTLRASTSKAESNDEAAEVLKCFLAFSN